MLPPDAGTRGGAWFVGARVLNGLTLCIPSHPASAAIMGGRGVDDHQLDVRVVKWRRDTEETGRCRSTGLAAVTSLWLPDKPQTRVSLSEILELLSIGGMANARRASTLRTRLARPAQEYE